MAEAAKQKKDLYFVHLAIGFVVMILFAFILPNPEPITPIGMKVVGIFLAMVYWWSTVGALWPSILGLFLLGISGIGDVVLGAQLNGVVFGESATPLAGAVLQDGTVIEGINSTAIRQNLGGSNGVWMVAVGNYTVLLVLFAMVLFGAVDEVGDTKYIAKWFLTRKIFAGRPYVFLALFYACCFALSATVMPMTALIIMWPIGVRLMEVMGIAKEDRIWKFFFVGMFLVMTLGQPFWPFIGAQLIPISAFSSMTAAMEMPMSIPWGPYMLVNFVMTTLIMAIYLLGIKFIARVDVSKMKSVNPQMVEETMPLPPMNGLQKAFLIMIPIYVIALLIPDFLPANPVSTFMKYAGPLGITAAFVLFFLIVRYEGKPMLDFREVAYHQFNWGIFFMIAAAVYAATLLSNPATGVSAWLVQVLNPILGGQPEMVFVALMFLVALIITNFANNAAMAVVLLPVVINFSTQIGINPIPVAMGVILMVFVAMLTPAASPHAGMMHGNKDIYKTSDILSIGFPMCFVALVAYVFIGYPLCKALVAAVGM
ncbi:MAG: anion permease [Eggerthellaceae bacterium]|nr:anion permease [Eggerthellaceae bacterium]